MGRPRKTAAKKPSEPELVWEDGYWWLVQGTKKENVGRSRRYAERLLADRQAS